MDGALKSTQNVTTHTDDAHSQSDGVLLGNCVSVGGCVFVNQAGEEALVLMLQVAGGGAARERERSVVSHSFHSGLAAI